MQVSIALPPGPSSLDLTRVAEQCGCARVWLYDSPALYEDVWMRLVQVAEGTESIGIGAGVLVPHLRHVMVTASAIATLEAIAPGRTAHAFGTGATARWTMDQPALPWDAVASYMRRLRALLAGEVVEIDGRACQMIHHEAWALARPVDVPLLLSAFGPKGQALAAQIADGIMTMVPSLADPTSTWSWWAQLVTGTVLDPEEDLRTERVREAAGPWSAVVYHGTWQAAHEAVDFLPGGREWREEIERLRPEGERHLAVHEGHVTDLTDRDRSLFLGRDVSGPLGWIGSVAEVRELAAASEEVGVTELVYAPSGPDMEREIERFAAAISDR